MSINICIIYYIINLNNAKYVTDANKLNYQYIIGAIFKDIVMGGSFE